NGQRRVYDSIVAPVHEGDSNIGVLGVNIDATERRDLLAQLYQSQKMESIGRLAGGVAHDFNNLLTGILGYSEVALHKLGASNDACHDVQEIRRIASRAAELTRQLLMFSRKNVVEPRV